MVISHTYKDSNQVGYLNKLNKVFYTKEYNTHTFTKKRK